MIKLVLCELKIHGDKVGEIGGFNQFATTSQSLNNSNFDCFTLSFKVCIFALSSDVRSQIFFNRYDKVKSYLFYTGTRR